MTWVVYSLSSQLLNNTKYISFLSQVVLFKYVFRRCARGSRSVALRRDVTASTSGQPARFAPRMYFARSTVEIEQGRRHHLSLTLCAQGWGPHLGLRSVHGLRSVQWP